MKRISVLKLSIVFAIYITVAAFILPHQSPVKATNIDTSNSDNYNIRIIGSSASSKAGYIYKDISHDINDNGSNDLVVCEYQSDNNSRSNSGSCYIIYDSILTTITGTGNDIDLSDNTKWNIRFDGAVAGDTLGNGGVSFIDMGDDGEVDMLLASPGSDNVRNRSGSVYVINQDIFGGLSGTGNTLDLATSSNYTIRYDGATEPCEIGESFVKGIDLNDNGADDLIMASGHCGLGGRSRSGALFIIYDSLLNTYAGTGNTVDLATTSTYNLVFYEATGSYFTISNDLVTQDIDGNGKLDIVTGITNGDKNGRTDSGSVIVIYDSIIDNYVGTGNQIDLTDTANFNIRYDGVGEFDYFGWGGIAAADLDTNGKLDLILSSTGMDMNSRDDSGSMFVIYDSLIDDDAGTGNIHDMTTSTNWNIRFDGATASEYFGGYHDDRLYDYNNDGLVDIVIPASGAGYNSRAESGSIYIIYNALFSGLTETGNTVDMATTSNYSHRIDGATSGDYFGFYIYQNDFDGDDTYDLFSSAFWSSPLGRTSAGSDYIVYNFPHTLTKTSASRTGSHVTVEGTITASNSSTGINGFQYQIDSNSPLTGWTDCTAQDGDFDSTAEGFICTISNSPTNSGTHIIYMRAYNDLTVYTPQSHYLTYSYTIGSGSSSSSTGKGKSQPKPQVKMNEGGVIHAVSTYEPSSQALTVILEDKNIPFDATLESDVEPLEQKSIKVAQGTAWIIGEVQNLWLKDFYNDAKILQPLQSKPSIVSLSYTSDMLKINGKPGDVFGPDQLKLAYTSDLKKWTILPSSVVDSVNRTVSAVDTIGGYYTIVALPNGRRVSSAINYESDKVLSVSDTQEAEPQVLPMKEKRSMPEENKPIDQSTTLFDRIVSVIRKVFE